MKIGFDVSQTSRTKAGCGFFAENLIHHLSLFDKQNQYLLYPTFGNHYWSHDFKNTFCNRLPNFNSGLSHNDLFEAIEFWKNDPNEIEQKLGNVDILHSNNFFCPPKFSKTKIVYTLYDLSFLEYPECTTEHNRIACFDNLFKASLNADFIIAISNYTRNHFLQICPYFPVDRIRVIYPGNRLSGNHKDIKLSKKLKQFMDIPFWLNVGTIEPRKNILRLLRAYSNLLKQNPNTFPLVLAGSEGWLSNIQDTINILNLKNKVHILGYVDNEELQWLYQNCFCFIYPSLFEGFGLPILEAMTFGKPVISSYVTSIPEVIGDSGVLINPLIEDEILEAMLLIERNKNYRKELMQKALKQAARFSWDNSAKEMLRVYEYVNALPKKYETKLESNISFRYKEIASENTN